RVLIKIGIQRKVEFYGKSSLCYKFFTQNIIFPQKYTCLAFQQKKVQLSRDLRSRFIDFCKYIRTVKILRFWFVFAGVVLSFPQTALFFPKTTFYWLSNKKKFGVLSLLGSRVID